MSGIILPPVIGVYNSRGPFIDIKAYAKLGRLDPRHIILLHFDNTPSPVLRRNAMRYKLESVLGGFYPYDMDSKVGLTGDMRVPSL